MINYPTKNKLDQGWTVDPVYSDIPREAVVCFDEYVGPGYPLPIPEMAEAVRILARLESVLIDPVYTGGSPALYVYMSEILE